MNHLLAQSIKVGQWEIKGPIQNINSIADIINAIMTFLMPLSGVLLLVYIIWGGFDYLLSHGEPERIKSGKHKIIYALIGFCLLFFSYLVIRLIVYVLRFGGDMFQ